MKSSGILVAIALSIVLILPTHILATTVTFREGDGGAYSSTHGATVYPVDKVADGSSVMLSALTGLNWDMEWVVSSVSFVRFPDIFGANAGQIPPGSTIEAAYFSITRATYSAFRAYLKLADSAWDESTITGESYPGVLNAYLADIPTGVATHVIDVTGVLQAWSDGTANYGFVIADDSSNEQKFYSDDAATAEHRPQLTVTFTTTTATESSTWGKVKALYR